MQKTSEKQKAPFVSPSTKEQQRKLLVNLTFFAYIISRKRRESQRKKIQRHVFLSMSANKKQPKILHGLVMPQPFNLLLVLTTINQCTNLGQKLLLADLSATLKTLKLLFCLLDRIKEFLLIWCSSELQKRMVTS